MVRIIFVRKGVPMQAVAANKMRIHIVLTNTAREAIKEHTVDEQTFFKQQKAFIVYIEKLELVDGQISCTLYFDGEKNKGLAKKFPDRICIMDCLFDPKSGLVAKSFRTRGKGTPVATNRRARMLLEIIPSRMNGHKYPKEFLEKLANLPFSKERYDYVNKRITSWEGYLKVLNKNADFEDIEATFSKTQFNSAYTHITMKLNGLNGKQWKQLDKLSARVKGYHQDLGDVVKVNRQEQTVEIEMKPDMARLARKHELHFDYTQIIFSNMATKSQLKRLLQGFERLKEGLAVNPNLERILFEDKPAISPKRKPIQIEYSNRLNEFQQAAVQGAMETDDLYVIQGPPGTGKTTVISEICYQNAIRGLKTLVASQSNLAVDNALSRLLTNKDIRILRYGRTESIEEDGKRFIEENVGKYWKEITTLAIEQAVEGHPFQENQLKQQIIEKQQKIEQNKTLLQELEETLIKQKEAEQQKPNVELDIKKRKRKILEANKLLDEKNETHVRLEEKLAKLEDSLLTIKNKSTDSYKSYSFNEDDLQAFIHFLQTKLAGENEQITQLLKQQDICQLLNEQKLLQKEIEAKKAELELYKPKQNDRLEEEISQLKKVKDVEEFIVSHKVRRSFVIDRLNASLADRQQKLERFKGIQEIYERLKKALDYCENKVGLTVHPELLPHHHSYTLIEVNEFLTKLSKAFAERKITRENGVRSVQGIHLRKQFVENEIIQYNTIVNDTIIIFGKLKEELLKLFQEQENEHFKQLKPIEESIAHMEERLIGLNKQLVDVDCDAFPEITTIQQKIRQAKLSIQAIEEAIHHANELLNDFNRISLEKEQMEQEIHRYDELKFEMEAEIKQWHKEGIVFEQQLQELNSLLAIDVTGQIQQTKEQQQVIQQEVERLETQIQKLPLIQAMQKQWLEMLQDATDEDVDEIRKLYVKHANVIGTTCVTSANKEFMDNYPNFDVVIIDEVSKATPPELLLPMLKGAKIILVGDHHQLPPLIGDDTLEETLEQVVKESTNFEEKREIEKLLEESLFERLYNQLPRENKQMLAIQYRMHANIMETIAPFYEQESDKLMCGLENSDEARNHKLETHWFNQHNHLLWLDVPREKAYFEQRPKEGSSLFNESELSIIKQVLQQLNDATANAMESGTLPQGTQKSVGVISFYAEQVKRINRMLEQELQLPYLQIRTGSVDKFQGMEMDVILVSMVRNHDHERGDIGFAKDYRRLNVALSRSRELLMMIGSAEMFTERPKNKEVRKMYQHVLDTAHKQNGYIQVVKEGFIHG